VKTGIETILVVRDLEALSRAIANGAEWEAKYQSLIAHVPAISYTRAPEEGAPRRFMTERVRRLLGYGARELLEDRELFSRLVHPEDHDRVADKLGVMPEPGGVTRIEYRLIARDGRTVWVEDVSAVVLGDGGRPLCVQGFCTMSVSYVQRRESNSACRRSRLVPQRKPSCYSSGSLHWPR
jgi:PAS domain S-box